MKSEFGSSTLGHPSSQEKEGREYASKLSNALDLATKFHKLRKRLVTELADLANTAHELGLGADASILTTLHAATLLTKTKFIRQDLDVLALSASLRAK